MAVSHGNEARLARRRHGISVGPFAQLLLLVVIASAAGAAYWANKKFTVTSIVHGSGSVVPAGKVQRVLSPMDGAVMRYGIREGMTVEVDQILFRIRPKDTASEAGALESTITALRASIVRLEAESGGEQKLTFPEDLAGQTEVQREQEAFDARRARLDRKLRDIGNATAKAKLDIAEQTAAAGRYARARDLAQEELDVLKPLVTRGISPKLEYLRVQQKVQELEAQRQKATLAVPRLTASLRETERRLEEIETTFRAQARRELGEKQSELSLAQREASKDRSPKVAIDIRAPIRGTVLKLFIEQDDETVRTGQNLIEVTPHVEALFAEVQLQTSDSAGLQIGQAATVTALGLGLPSLSSVIAEIDQNGRENSESRISTNVKIRINPDSPAFDRLSRTGGRVGVAIESENSVLDYLWDTLIAARRKPFPWP
jgi:adhesin transport system membrane fusion protein